MIWSYFHFRRGCTVCSIIILGLNIQKQVCLLVVKEDEVSNGDGEQWMLSKIILTIVKRFSMQLERQRTFLLYGGVKKHPKIFLHRYPKFPYNILVHYTSYTAFVLLTLATNHSTHARSYNTETISVHTLDENMACICNYSPEKNCGV